MARRRLGWPFHGPSTALLRKCCRQGLGWSHVCMILCVITFPRESPICVKGISERWATNQVVRGHLQVLDETHCRLRTSPHVWPATTLSQQHLQVVVETPLLFKPSPHAGTKAMPYQGHVNFGGQTQVCIEECSKHGAKQSVS